MTDEKKFVVVTLSGKDRPGITATFTNILLNHDIHLADIDQATLQDFLALTMLLEFSTPDAAKDSVLKDLLFEANRLDMRLNFQLLSEHDLRVRKDKNLFVMTFFGNTKALASVSRLLGEENANIEKISNLSRSSAECFELLVNVRKVQSLSRLKERALAVTHELNVDMAFQKYEAYRKGKRLVLFDMDQTLLDMEVIDEIAREAGVFEQVSRVTEKAMRGDLDFEESLRQRVALLKGLNVDRLEHIRDNLRMSEGAEVLIRTLKKMGYRVGVVSGGFTFFADHLVEKLGMDFAHANKLEIKGGELTGKVEGAVIDGAAKAKIAQTVANELGVMLDQTVAIGDGANDSLMLGQAGLGIAYNAKASLEQITGVKVGHTRLLNILYMLGITEADIAS